MEVTFWGTRGSIAAPGPETTRYGGNTSCVEVRGPQGTLLVLDAGTGIRRMGAHFPRHISRVDLLLTHLHMDHIQGLGFFGPFYNPALEVHIWGPASTTLSLRSRLMRYLSPPLFPVLLRDLPCQLHLHEVPSEAFEVGEFRVTSALICHPGPTVGYRVEGGGATLAYMPDHEPALGAPRFPLHPDWTSGYELAAGVDMLIHDAQYTGEEYLRHVGWGHSGLPHTLAFAALAGAKHLVPFHHDPGRDDESLARAVAEAVAEAQPSFAVTPAAEGDCYKLGASVIAEAASTDSR